jgi:hypothetical protein
VRQFATILEVTIKADIAKDRARNGHMATVIARPLEGVEEYFMTKRSPKNSRGAVWTS